MEYIMLLVSDLLLAVNFSANKIYQKKAGTALKTGFGFNAILGLFTAIIFFAVNGFTLDFSFFSLAMSAIKTSAVVAYTLIGFRLMKMGSMSIYTMFLMAGGMTLPYIWGILFLDEPLTFFGTLALVFIFAGVVLSNFSKTKISASQICMCVAVFVLNGTTSISSKIHQIEQTYKCVGENEFIILGGLFQLVVCGIIYMLLKKNDEEKKQPVKATFFLLIVVVCAFASGGAGFMQLVAAKSVPATALYPFVTGGTIVFSTLTDFVIFKEKISKQLVISVILCVLGTLMFLF